MSTQTLRRTALHGLQKELGAKFVPFHGWELPVQFTTIMQEHAAVRNAAGLFDVSHMGQVEVFGPQALDFVQRVQSNDAAALTPGRALYAHVLNERGGVVDDIIVSRLGPERFFIVVNAATIDKDLFWFRRQASGLRVEVEDKSDFFGMLALQGPLAARVLEAVSAEPAALKRFGALECELYGSRVLFTRTGYTGEDGFEIIAPAEILSRLWGTLSVRGASFGLLPCGLGARDTLRLEAGYLLYGSDIDDDHSPLEAGYAWVVKPGKADFTGKQALAEQLSAGLARKLRGVRLVEGGVPRPGAPVTLSGKPAGALTSAGYSPTLKTGIGMGYLSPADLRAGTPVSVGLHGREARAEIVELPFYRRPKS